MKNFVKPGHMMTMIATTPITAGAAYQVGTVIGVAAISRTQAQIDAGEVEVEIATTGVYAFANPDQIVVAQGALVGYDQADNKIVAAGSGDFDLGTAHDPILAGTSEAEVLLAGGAGHSAR